MLENIVIMIVSDSENQTDKLDSTNIAFSHSDDVKIQNNMFNIKAYEAMAKKPLFWTQIAEKYFLIRIGLRHFSTFIEG